MKSKVIIQDEKIEIILIAENEFEIDIVEKIKDNDYKGENFYASYKVDYGTIKKEHCIGIHINKRKK